MISLFFIIRPGAGKDLDPEHYLGPQRHGEWTAFTGAGEALHLCSAAWEEM